MTISSTTVIDKVEVLQMGQLQIRQAEVILKDNRNWTILYKMGKRTR